MRKFGISQLIPSLSKPGHGVVVVLAGQTETEKASATVKEQDYEHSTS